MISSANTPFSIDGFSYDEGIFTAEYTVPSPDGAVSLSETIDFSRIDAVRQPEPALLRMLALSCSLSYYKATRGTDITIAFAITDAELAYFTAVLTNGLGEYAYRNDLFDKLNPTITSRPLNERQSVAREWKLTGRPLVPVGGGKDSVVTIESLKAAGFDPLLFSVNRYDPIDRCVITSGCDYVSVTRKLDPKLNELNRNGAPNGHVPVTAVNSLISLIVADIMAIGPVVMSNEASASAGNLQWHGREINHQWSKSLEFEDLLRATLETSGLQPDRYFSLLRSLREIDIAERFAGFPQYFSEFTSCNRVFTLDPAKRHGAWCGECPKCLFVYLILAPFMSRDDLIKIFGHDLLDAPQNEELYKEILGLSGHKPFECVGEYDEAVEALISLSEKPEWGSSRLVATLRRAVGDTLPAPVGALPDRVPDIYRKAAHETVG